MCYGVGRGRSPHASHATEKDPGFVCKRTVEEGTEVDATRCRMMIKGVVRELDSHSTFRPKIGRGMNAISTATTA